MEGYNWCHDRQDGGPLGHGHLVQKAGHVKLYRKNQWFGHMFPMTSMTQKRGSIQSPGPGETTGQEVLSKKLGLWYLKMGHYPPVRAMLSIYVHREHDAEPCQTMLNHAKLSSLYIYIYYIIYY